jgi:putative ATPase
MSWSHAFAHSAGGDARVALTALDAAVESTTPDDGGARSVTRQTVIEALGRAHYAYDKGGEEHYNLSPPLIKSLRNSDVNAGLYWLARMIEGGADPIYIARRLCILASKISGSRIRRRWCSRGRRRHRATNRTA